MSDIQVRKLSAAEFDKFRDLRIKALTSDPSAFAEYYEKYDDETDAKWRKYLESSDAEKKSVLLFALDGDKAVGMVGAIFENNPKVEHVAKLFGVFVDSDYRGKGIGKMLLESILDKVVERGGVLKIVLDVNPAQTEAVGLYHKFGFKTVGKLSKELKIDGEYHDLEIMELFL
jgi:ribosomal protein S18 acetylase RimI-like enzyme